MQCRQAAPWHGDSRTRLMWIATTPAAQTWCPTPNEVDALLAKIYADEIGKRRPRPDRPAADGRVGLLMSDMNALIRSMARGEPATEAITETTDPPAQPRRSRSQALVDHLAARSIRIEAKRTTDT